jgi:hypothetical protein
MNIRRVIAATVMVALLVGAFFVGRATVTSSRPPTLQSKPLEVTHNVDPAAVDFLTPTSGWVIGTWLCHDSQTCFTLRKTTNQGASWSTLSFPASLQKQSDPNGLPYVDSPEGGPSLSVLFANVNDGWLYGSRPVTVQQGNFSYTATKPVMFATTDGGTNWTSIVLPREDNTGQVYDVEANTRAVYALLQFRGNDAVVDSAQISSANWRQANTVALGGEAGGSPPFGAIVLKGSSGWLVEGNDRGVGGSAQLNSAGEWVAWPNPCAALGNSYAVPVAQTPSHLVTVCGMGGFAYPIPSTAPAGAVTGSSWLYFSSDGGQSFQAGHEIKPVKQASSFGEYSDVFASPAPDHFVTAIPYGEGQRLLLSGDNGATWHTALKEPKAFFTYLHFVSRLTGVCLVEEQNNSEVLMLTKNGGRSWSDVTL